ncbi:hypothetical protein [Corallococcus caeni]|uniref:Uncharacterized protein n=1 Tax=Corallococcus caeni TaxID=3082388 RepID=A0ABQ6QQS9_9BACT|nr:hypothetical protein ASNO1_26360 [Corallococcus sp. NO1]
MPKAPSDSSRRLAVLEPKDKLGSLTSWWKADSLEVLRYRMYKIKVGDVKASTLSFELVGDGWQNHPKRHQSVDLDVAAHVYPEIPSTLRNAKKEQYAFLLLTDAFMTQATEIGEGDLEKYAEGGGKWPFGAGGKKLTKSDAIEALSTLQALIDHWPEDLT